MTEITYPLKITVQHTESDQIISSNQVQSQLSLPPVQKMIDHPLFNEYAATLYNFANIVAKADNTFSKEEETILKEIYQITHNLCDNRRTKLLKISKVNKEESLDEVLNELEILIGLSDVKEEVKSLIQLYKNSERKRES